MLSAQRDYKFGNHLTMESRIHELDNDHSLLNARVKQLVLRYVIFARFILTTTEISINGLNAIIQQNLTNADIIDYDL